MTSILTVIRDAVRPGAAPLSPSPENEPGAEALPSEAPLAEATTPGGDMTVNQSAPAAAPAAAGALAAVAAAASGGADGYKAAMDRMDAIFSAEGIKGDAGRMSAAFDLAKASPDMSAEAVVAFVATNVPASNSGAAPAAAVPSYEQQRLAAADLAMPPAGGSKAKSGPQINASSIFAMRRQAQKGA